MEIINHEYYVSLEVTKLLKEAGFNWKCNGAFLSEDGIQYTFIKMDAAWDSNNSKYNPHNISAPTLDVAQRWLREEKNREVFVECISGEKKYKCYYTHGLVNMATSNFYSTYEEAQEAGIKKALEIILECK